MRVSAHARVLCETWRLQLSGWFVKTSKHGTALEALAGRKPRSDI